MLDQLCAAKYDILPNNRENFLTPDPPRVVKKNYRNPPKIADFGGKKCIQAQPENFLHVECQSYSAAKTAGNCAFFFALKLSALFQNAVFGSRAEGRKCNFPCKKQVLFAILRFQHEGAFPLTSSIFGKS